MLAPSEFMIGSLADAKPLALVLPRQRYEEIILVGGPEDSPAAVFVGKDYRFQGFDNCADATNWKGLIVPDVSVEIDETSVFDPDAHEAPAGALVRSGDRLNIIGIGPDQYSIKRRRPFPLLVDLPAGSGGNSAGFLRWQIVLGQSSNRRILLTVEAASSKVES